MVKKGDGITIGIGGGGYSLSPARGGSGYSGGGSSTGYSLTSASKGYSLAGSGKWYNLSRGLDSMLRGYFSIAARGYNAGIKMRGYSIRQSYPVSLFPVPYSRVEGALRNEMFRKYKKKCPMCGKESGESISSSHYSFN